MLSCYVRPRPFLLSLVAVCVLCLCLMEWSLFPSYILEKEIKEKSIPKQREGKVVFLFSTQRSGSSFVGEFFNRYENGYYLFEPLLPYTPDCSKLYEERLQLLKEMSLCDFRNMMSSYFRAKAVYRVRTHKECFKARLCFSANHPTLLQRYSDLCNSVEENFSGNLTLKALEEPWKISALLKERKNFTPESSSCGYPLNLTYLSSLCRSSQLVSFKILRVCSISALRNITRELSSLGNEVYVIDLTRDPRAIINSALKLELKIENLDARLDFICNRWISNLKFVEEERNFSSDTKSFVQMGNYLLIRYEDIAMDPFKGAEKIYSHLGMMLPQEVRSWIEETSVSPSLKIAEMKETLSKGGLTEEKKVELEKRIMEITKESRSAYGTARDPQIVLRKWRTQLSMKTILRIQDKCGDVMKRLGYKLISSESERDNLDFQLF